VGDAIPQDFEAGQITETAPEPLTFVVAAGYAFIDRAVIGPGLPQYRDERNPHRHKPSEARSEIQNKAISRIAKRF
jgi:hypothetical protein